MNIQCSCGHTIHDVKENLPYKARVLRDQDEAAFCSAVAKTVSGLARAIEAGHREKWIARQLPPGARLSGNRDAILEGILKALLFRIQQKLSLTAYECEECGRLFIHNKPGSSEVSRFEPEYTTKRWLFASKPRRAR